MLVDLMIRDGTIVTAGSMGAADVGVCDGKIVQIGGDMQSHNEIDARDKYVFPGGVDVHVHLTPAHEPDSRSRDMGR